MNQWEAIRLNLDEAEQRIIAVLEALCGLRIEERVLRHLPMATEGEIAHLESCLHAGLRAIQAQREEFSDK